MIHPNSDSDQDEHLPSGTVEVLCQAWEEAAADASPGRSIEEVFDKLEFEYNARAVKPISQIARDASAQT